MRPAGKDGGADVPGFGRDALNEHRLADPGFALDNERSRRSTPHRIEQLSGNRQLGISANEVVSRQ
jgi:hypothetical protein